MTKVIFYKSENNIVGFEISGHSTQNCKDLNGKLLCSAISSVAYMVVNTLTEILNVSVSATVKDGKMKVVLHNKIKESQPLLLGLKLHFVELSKDYPKISLLIRRCKYVKN